METSTVVRRSGPCWRCGLVTHDMECVDMNYCTQCRTFQDDSGSMVAREVYQMQPDHTAARTHPLLLGGLLTSGRVGLAGTLVRLKGVSASLMTTFICVDFWAVNERPLVFLTRLVACQTGCVFDEYEARYPDYQAALAGHADKVARLQAIGAEVLEA